MHVVHSAIRYPPAIGGVERYVQQLSDGLASLGHEVTVYTSDLDQHTLGTYLNDASTVDRSGVRTYRLHAKYFPSVKGYPVIPTLPRNLAKVTAHILHGHSFYYTTADLTALAAYLRRIPFVLSPYYYSPHTAKWRLYHNTMGRIVMKADVVLCISEFEKELIERSGFRVKRFEIVPPWIDVAEFERPSPSFYAKFGIDSTQTPVLLFVGRIAPEKGLDILLRAFAATLARDPEPVLVLVGPDGGQRATIEQLAAELKCNQNLIFAGQVSRTELIAAYQQATMFVFPTLYEAFGIVLIEAMAAGLPVIAANAAAVPFVVSHGETGILFPKQDSAALSRSITELLRDASQRRKLSETARQHVNRKFESRLQLANLENIYQSLLGRGRM
ncbi:MAG: glycosyltransferase family 4 protein [Chloroflexi bacterium]|nr:glycosyltransferase family 4 protein [Chloroflexota bacterium]